MRDVRASANDGKIDKWSWLDQSQLLTFADQENCDPLMEQAVHLAVVAAIRLSRLEAEMEGEYKCM
jgi:hypothetical protein